MEITTGSGGKKTVLWDTMGRHVGRVGGFTGEGEEKREAGGHIAARGRLFFNV